MKTKVTTKQEIDQDTLANHKAFISVGAFFFFAMQIGELCSTMINVQAQNNIAEIMLIGSLIFAAMGAIFTGYLSYKIIPKAPAIKSFTNSLNIMFPDATRFDKAMVFMSLIMLTCSNDLIKLINNF